jgi:hypothetical protein
MIEHIKNEVRLLRPDERLSLWREIGTEYNLSDEPDADEISIDAAWEEEIGHRDEEVRAGAVELQSADEVEAHTSALFVELGLTRKPHLA